LYQRREKTEKNFDPERKPSDVKEDRAVYRQLGKMKHSFQGHRKFLFGKNIAKT
jgi:hypothetical protein